MAAPGPDYLFVKSEQLDAACKTLREAGHNLS
jgi:hypothetical protein